MSTEIYLLTLGMPLFTVLLVFAMRYLAQSRAAAARIAEEAAWRRTAEGAVSAQTETAAALTAQTVALSDIRERLAVVELILKGVE